MKKETEMRPGELSEEQIEDAVGGLIVQPPTTPPPPKTGGIGGTPLSENQLSDVSGGKSNDSYKNNNCYFMPTGEVEYRNNNTEKWMKCSSACGNLFDLSLVDTCICFGQYWCKDKWHMVYIAGSNKDYLVERDKKNHASKNPLNGYAT